MCVCVGGFSGTMLHRGPRVSAVVIPETVAECLGLEFSLLWGLNKTCSLGTLVSVAHNSQVTG